MSKNFRMLAIAAASGRVGFVLLRGKNLIDWGMSRKASRSPIELQEVAKKWFEKFEPDMIVTEMAYSDVATKADITRCGLASPHLAQCCHRCISTLVLIAKQQMSA